MRKVLSLFLAFLPIATFTNGCGSVETDSGGVRLVTATEAASITADPPADLVVLDVRTPDEFAAGHLDGAVMIDFYSDDFAEQIAVLDPNASYVLYCRSGNRSGQAASIMKSLGFNDVADIDGGIMSWLDAGFATTTR